MSILQGGCWLKSLWISISDECFHLTMIVNTLMVVKHQTSGSSGWATCKWFKFNDQSSMLYVTSNEVGIKFFKTRWSKMSSLCIIKEIASFKRLAFHLHRIVTFINHPFPRFFWSSVLNSNTLYWLFIVGNARGFGDGNATLVLCPSVCIKYNNFLFTLDIDICDELFFLLHYLIFAPHHHDKVFFDTCEIWVAWTPLNYTNSCIW
jgi:hypothetical protein